MANHFLLEIGTEELPWGAQEIGRTQLKENAEASLARHRLVHSGLEIYSTPRRLTLLVRSLEERQQSKEELIKGPAASSAYDQDGNPTQAAIGFARSRGVDVSQLEVRETDKGEFVFARVREEGRSSLEVLPEFITELLYSFSFPKSMRWGTGDFRFARPIRWILALYGREIVPIQLESLRSSDLTYGHRFLAENPIKIDDPSFYLDKLEEARVIAREEDRRERILRQIEELTRTRGMRPVLSPELLDEIVDLVEYPGTVLGSLDREFLQLPREVLITAMQEHQRYIPVESQDGELQPYFLVVHNGNPQCEEVIRKGNERVLRARLADAEFFFREDTKVRLEDRVGDLDKVVYQAQLGTLYQKTLRLEKLCAELARLLHVGEEVKIRAVRAAQLSKADLVTSMVIEFPLLQGTMGRIYARIDGEADQVAQALEEQYLPRYWGDRLPDTMEGVLLSLAEKLDNLAGCFGVGLVPSGSMDPYALRRQAQGIFVQLLEKEVHLDLGKAVAFAVGQYDFTNGEEVQADLKEFLLQRLRQYLLNREYPYDIVNAVLENSLRDPRDAFERLLALVAARKDGRLERLYTAFERCYNLSWKMERMALDEGLLLEEAERDLHSRVVWSQQPLREALDASDFSQAIDILLELKPAIDLLFDTIFIMGEDEMLRNNRIALLQETASLFLELADLSHIVPGLVPEPS